EMLSASSLGLCGKEERELKIDGGRNVVVQLQVVHRDFSGFGLHRMKKSTERARLEHSAHLSLDASDRICLEARRREHTDRRVRHARASDLLVQPRLDFRTSP